MRKYIGLAAAAIAALPLATSTTTVDARPYHRMYGNHHYSYGYGHRRHRGHGYWHNGRWIALGVGAAILGAAAANAYDDCYWRHGYRYCDY